MDRRPHLSGSAAVLGGGAGPPWASATPFSRGAAAAAAAGGAVGGSWRPRRWGGTKEPFTEGAATRGGAGSAKAGAAFSASALPPACTVQEILKDSNVPQNMLRIILP